MSGKKQRSATPRSLTGWVGGNNKTQRAATAPDFDSGWCVAIKKLVPGFLSGMDFLLARTTRTWQRWRDGEGAFGSCLHRDVAAINKRHFCTQQTGAADHAAKGEGATNHQPRFAAPRQRRWNLILTCVAAFTRRAQDITASYATGRRVSGAQHLHKMPLCWMPPHTNNRRSRQCLARTV